MIVTFAQFVGTLSMFILFCINLYILSSEDHFQKSGRVIILWLTIYGFFLFLVRVLSLIHFGTLDQLRIISGFASFVPLLMVIINLLLSRGKENKPVGKPQIVKTIIMFSAINILLFAVTSAIAQPLPKDYNCSDFQTQEAAQDKFKEHTTDIYHLDGNHDGIACNGLLKK